VRRAALWRYTPVVLVLLAVFLICRARQETGHDWGDDWTLYLRQAEALAKGNVGEVITTNRITVDESSWSTFSPYVYPWGFPILLAPLYAVFGLNIGMFKLLETVLFCGFLFLLQRFAARRIGEAAALGLVLVLGVNRVFVGWTDYILSEFPYLFAVGVLLLWLDRVRERDELLGPRLRPLLVLGLLSFWVFSIRREALAFVLAVGAAQVIALWQDGWVRRPLASWPWRALVTPYAALAGAVVALQMMLPSDLFPKYPTGTQHLRTNWDYYYLVFADHLGLRDGGGDRIHLLGSQGLATAVLWSFLLLAALGALWRAISAPSRDLPPLAGLAGVAYGVMTFPYPDGRYVFVFTPFLAYFAYQGAVGIEYAVRTAFGATAERLASVRVYLAPVLLCGVLLSVASDLRRDLDYHVNNDYVIDGPFSPEAQELIDVVRSTTRSDDILGFFRARAMNFFTDRQTLQLTQLDQILARVDYYVMEADSDYSQYLLTDAEAAEKGIVMAWRNRRWILWRVPERATVQAATAVGSPAALDPSSVGIDPQELPAGGDFPVSPGATAP
jgi:hypothetical protein